MKPSVTLLILAYNEEENIGDTIRNCNSACKSLFDDYELLVCDDASSDSTGRIADRLAKSNRHVDVFHNKRKMGVGYNIRKGIHLAKKDYFMWVPGDNEVRLESIRKMLRHTGDADLVISYIGNPKVRPLYRQVISKSFTKTMNLLFGLRLGHFLGMTLCKTSLIKKLKLTTNSSCVMAEVILKLIKTGHTYRQVPIVMRKKKMSGNIFRLRNVTGLVKTVGKLFFMLQIVKRKDIFRE